MSPDQQDFIDAAMTMGRSITMFHERFECKPGTLESRISLIMEELGECAKAANEGHEYEVINEMADVAFVTLASLELMGRPAIEALFRIALKNDDKTLDTHFRHPLTGKVTRGRLYTNPTPKRC